MHASHTVGTADGANEAAAVGSIVGGCDTKAADRHAHGGQIRHKELSSEGAEKHRYCILPTAGFSWLASHALHVEYAVTPINFQSTECTTSKLYMTISLHFIR